jgi:tRNA-uridine 2-sulfurtransferase
MGSEELRTHLEYPDGQGQIPDGAFTGAAGGAACGDLIRISVTTEPEDPVGRISDAGFDASGCATALAAGSAAVTLVRGRPLLDAARVGAREIAAELGGLSPAKRHAAELAGDALHRALGALARGAGALTTAPARTLVAMSGGVDSAVAALLAAREHSQPVGVTLELWSDPENDGELSCCSAQAVRGAREVAHQLGMAHFSLDLRAEFRAGVVDPWLTEHREGLTPNPCVRCNGNVRLDAMLELADRLGSPTLTTGHYARTHTDSERLEEALLRLAADEGKDQSYVLAALSPQSLARLRFPLGDLHKTQVRELARDAGLAVAAKRDSQDLCFLAGTGQRSFLARHGTIEARRGEIIDTEGHHLGEHDGHQGFTVGQRRGIHTPDTRRLYVLDTDALANTVTVGLRHQLLTQTVGVREVTLRRHGSQVDAVKVRSRGKRLACRTVGEPPAGHHKRLDLGLIEPHERTAPGQHACLYSGDLIIGHGTICG